MDRKQKKVDRGFVDTLSQALMNVSSTMKTHEELKQLCERSRQENKNRKKAEPPLEPDKKGDESEPSMHGEEDLDEEGLHSEEFIGTYSEEETMKASTATMIPNFILSKGYLMKTCKRDGISVYDHLIELIRRILLERPREGLDLLEEYSWRLKYERTKVIKGFFRRRKDNLLNFKVALLRWRYIKEHINKKPSPKIKKPMLNEAGEEEEEGADEDGKLDSELSDLECKPLGYLHQIKPPLPLLVEFFEKTGLGMTREDLVHIYMSIVRMAKKKCFSSVRFWGKITSLRKDYIIIETTFITEGEDFEGIVSSDEESGSEENSDDDFMDETWVSSEKEPSKESTVELTLSEDEGEEEEELLKVVPDIDDLLPDEELMAEMEDESGGGEGAVKAPTKVMQDCKDLFEERRRGSEPEPLGEGTNAFIYFVSTSMGNRWQRLPDVLPDQIAGARKFTKFFSGRLTSEVKTFPPFRYKEFHYLRAQIARISAATSVSPRGLFLPEEEPVLEEGFELEDDGAPPTVIPNPNYKPLPLKDMLQLNNWLHDRPVIFPLGRCNTLPVDPGSAEEFPKITVLNPDGTIEVKTGRGEEDRLDKDSLEDGDDSEDLPPSSGEGDSLKTRPEKSPGILGPIASDRLGMVEGSVWAAFNTSRLFPERNLAGVTSHVWPGAYALTNGRDHVNLYLGFGLKRFQACTPPVPALPKLNVVEDIQEVSDPDDAPDVEDLEALEEEELSLKDEEPL